MTDMDSIKAKEILKTAGVIAYDVKVSLLIDEASARTIGVSDVESAQLYLEDILIEAGFNVEHLEASKSDMDAMDE